MTVRPFFRELMSLRRHRIDLFNQYFGFGAWNDNIFRCIDRILEPPFQSFYIQPIKVADVADTGMSSLHSDKKGFRISVNVQEFKPNELKIKVEDGYLVIDGKHEERSDEHGFISREFTRRFKLPENVDENAIMSTLSSDGILNLKAPKKILPKSEAREIPINFSNEAEK